MNEQMKLIFEKIQEYDRIVIFRHKRPDGDATGSTKGLLGILKLTYPEKDIYLQNCDFPAVSDFLLQAEGHLPRVPVPRCRTQEHFLL